MYEFDPSLISSSAAFTVVDKLLVNVIQPYKNVKFMHRDIYCYINARVVNIKGNEIKIKLSDYVFDIIFSQGDTFSLISTNGDNVYKLDCVFKEYVVTDIFFDTFEITANISCISLKKELRSYKRYLVNILGEIKSVQKRMLKSVKIKDISQKGFRIISNSSLDVNEIFDFTVLFEEREKLNCTIKVITKTSFGNIFLYGLEIISISKSNEQILNDYLKNMCIIS